MIRPVAQRVMMSAWCLGLVLAAGGCEVPAYVATVITGPPKIPAVYELMDRPTVVLVDDYHNKLPAMTLASLLAGRTGEALKDHEVIETLIPSTTVDTLRARHEDFRKWPIDRIGRQVGAEQVLYISIERYQMTDEQQIFHPRVDVRVKVIDVASGTRMFPAGDQAYPLVSTLHYRNMEGAGAGTQAVLANRLMEYTADKIAKLFYKHKQPEAGSGLSEGT